MMITYTCRLIKFSFLILFAIVSFASYGDNAISKIDVAYEGGKKLDRYNVHLDKNPEYINVVVDYTNTTPSGTLSLRIYPVVGLTDWIKNEGITNTKLLENSMEKQAEFYSFDEILKPGNGQHTFKAINLASIITYYSSKHLWPRNLIFEVFISVSNKESSLKNNYYKLIVPIDPID